MVLGEVGNLGSSLVGRVEDRWWDLLARRLSSAPELPQTLGYVSAENFCQKWAGSFYESIVCKS